MKSFFEVELKNANTCVKKCYGNDILLDFKKCYKICTDQKKQRDILLNNYVYKIISNIKNPQTTNSQKDTFVTPYIIPDFYYKSKHDDFRMDAKKHVGALFGRNK
jgi:hypothetical protein